MQHCVSTNFVKTVDNNFTINQIVSTFPEGSLILQRIIKEDENFLKEKETLKQNIESRLVNKVTMDDIKITAELVVSYWSKNIIEHIKPINQYSHEIIWPGRMVAGESREKRLERCRKLLDAYQRKKEHLHKYEEMVQKAREYPINNLVQIKKGGYALCPLHKEKTPSFKIYKDNKWRCFGCNEYGDVIDLYQKINNVSFKEAIKALQ